MPQALKQSVEEALMAYSPLRESRPEITVTVDDGVVTLSGYVASTSIREMAAIMAGSVSSVNEVVNELHADPKLERSVALALAQVICGIFIYRCVWSHLGGGQLRRGVAVRFFVMGGVEN